jgi:hypothetical protein
MITNITQAVTSNEIIGFIHPALIAQIPAEDLLEIAENILLIEMYCRAEKFLSSPGVLTTRFYSTTFNQITRIEFGGNIYKI